MALFYFDNRPKAPCVHGMSHRPSNAKVIFLNIRFFLVFHELSNIQLLSLWALGLGFGASH